MEQPIKKNKFSQFADLAFGFVHKRSGNEIKSRLFPTTKLRMSMNDVNVYNENVYKQELAIIE